MVELPALPDPVTRLHLLRWRKLLETRGFADGEHLKWHESVDRRREVAKPSFSLRRPLVAGTSIGGITFCGPRGEPISYETWLEKEQAAWAARAEDPKLIDSIGIAETIALARARFEQVVGDYMAVWATMTDAHWKQIDPWLEHIQSMIIREVGDVWETSEWHTAWFQRACRRAVEDELMSLVKEKRSHATAMEILHLENPHITLRSLVESDGDLSIAYKLDQDNKSLESMRSAICLLEGINSTALGRAPAQLSSESTKKTDQSRVRLSDQSGCVNGARNGGDKPDSTNGDAAVKEGSRQHGFLADMDRHQAIVKIVERHDPHWNNHLKKWRKDSILKAICADLDQDGIDIPLNWKMGKTPSLEGVTLKGWADGFELGFKKLISEELRYSIHMVLKKSPPG